MRRLLLVPIIGFSIISTSFANIPTACLKLQKQLQSVLPSKLEISKSDDQNTLCAFQTSGSGSLYEKHHQQFATWSNHLEKMFKQDDWQEASEFAADAPFATQFAMKKASMLAKINFAVTGETSACPKDQPMDLYSNCHLTAKQRVYTLHVTIQQNH